MDLLDYLWESRDKKFVVIGLDGVPYSFLQKMRAGPRMPALSNLLAQG